MAKKKQSKEPVPEPVKETYPCLRVMPLAELTPNEKNPRKCDAEGLGRLTKSLHEFGNLQPVIFNIRTHKTLGGHQRIKCLHALGRKDTEVWCVDVPEEKEQAAMITLNKAVGSWDNPMLKDAFVELDHLPNFDLDATGFSKDELADLIGNVPNFQPASEDEQGRLDQKKPIKCPSCGHEFTVE